METANNILWPGWDTGEVLGRGSFGAVYEIHRDVFGDTEKAALKVISIPQHAGDIDAMYGDGYDEESITDTFRSHLKSIVAEYSLMRKLSGCVNIVNCDDVRYVQHDDGIGWDIFIKMELLTPLLKALPPQIPEEEAVKLGKDLCNALVECREYDIIHRDIKPQNIFISSRGDYKLGDFGIAKITEKTSGGTKTGTYKYMAPEVYNNQPYGTAADIYSLGLVLYWMLNERRMPFLPLPPAKLKAGMDEQARNRRFSGEPLPPPAHGSDALKQIVLKACAFDPKDRYASARQMLEALDDLENVPQPAAIPAEQRHPLQTDAESAEDATSRAATGAASDSDKTVLISQVPENKQKEKEPVPGGKKKKKHTSWMLLPFIAIVAALILWLADTAGLLRSEYNHFIPSNPTTAASQSTEETSPSKITPLTDCELIEDSNSAGSKKDVAVGNWVDTFGTAHSNAIKFWVINSQGMNNMEYVEYDLEQKYSELHIRFFLEEHSDPKATAYIRIYLDDVYIRSSRQIEKDSFDELTVDTEGAGKLRIECITSSKKEAFGLVAADLYS